MFGGRSGAARYVPQPGRPLSIRRIASADSSDLGRKPRAGLSAMRSAKSASAWVEIRMTIGPPYPSCSIRSRTLKAALLREHDVDQGEVRLELLGSAER